jgi:hypothetical protein
MHVGKLGRKKNALARLEAQLKGGNKRVHVSSDYDLPTDVFGQIITPLTEKDVTRIKREIETLRNILK